MTEDMRPDPQTLLRDAQRAERKPEGKLKIFFGYAAGVGKTYAMLEAARRARDAGVDVVAGYIEPPTRPETMALLEGLEQFAPRRVLYKGMELREFNRDAALARHPQLLLVDELAHTNAPGSRHAKRYQDVQELLRAGISVYTTVNVQHLESLNDVVASITGVTVAERVPDHVFDAAAHHVGVDLANDLLMADMDAKLIVQVVINLVNNAIKYTPVGSRITLSARRLGKSVEVRVTDDGPGIRDEAKEKLFDMFYTADNVRGDGRRGLGLGLSLCKSIVSAHGGAISVEDNPPHGASFCFTLHASEEVPHE